MTGVLTRESATIVLIALASGWALSKAARTKPYMAAVWVPLAAMAVLCAYVFFTPWSFVVSFDWFIADAVLGSTFIELVFFMFPGCPVGALAVGTATLTVGALLALWGGPRRWPLTAAAEAAPAG